MTQKEMIEEIWHKVLAPAPVAISKKTITIRRILEVATVAAVLGLIVGGIVLLVVGKLTAEDIARILEAWKG